MPRICTLCTHSELQAINEAIIAGTPSRRIAARFAGLSSSSVRRHAKDHLPLTLTMAAQAAEVVQATSLLTQVQRLHSEAAAILDAAKRSGDGRLCLLAIEKAGQMLSLQARMESELQASGESGPKTIRVFHNYGCNNCSCQSCASYRALEGPPPVTN